MTRISRLRRALTIAALAAAAFSSAAEAAFPDKPVRLVLPLSPGGAMDALGRGLAEQLGAQWNVPVIVENRAGAGGNIASELVARAQPDGYTLLLTGDMLVANQTLFKNNVNYDAERSFAPVGIVAVTPPVIVVRADSDIQDIAGLRRLGSQRLVNVGTPGYGNSNHMALARLQGLYPETLLHVPYKGAGPAVVALLAGETDAAIVAVPAAANLIRTGKLRGLAVLQAERSPIIADVPTAREAGLDLDSGSGWFGMLAPAGTAPEVVQRIGQSVKTALDEPAFRERLRAQGFEAIGGTPADFADRIRSDAVKFPALLQQTGVSVN
jgi:tripartite-type tricarboxylate transporter receptor subunit TctC